MVTKVEITPINAMRGSVKLFESDQGLLGLLIPGGGGWRPIKRTTVVCKS